MTNLDFGDALIASRPRKASAFGADFSEAFFNESALKRALSALQRGPIRFHRNNVIACDGDKCVAAAHHLRPGRQYRDIGSIRLGVSTSEDTANNR